MGKILGKQNQRKRIKSGRIFFIHYIKFLFQKVSLFVFVLFLIFSQNLLLITPSYAATDNWTFDSSDYYTFDSNKIEISSGQAQLKIPTGWYNSSWIKRRPVTIDNTGNGDTLTSYQVRVSIAYDANMQSDFDDVRFTDSDGTTLIDYWRESKIDSESAIFWVEVPTITASSNKNIYMYYGNSGASYTGNGSNVFLYYNALANADDLADLGSSFGTATWSAVSDADSPTGFAVSAVIGGANHVGRYKSLILPSEYVTEVYVSDEESSGSWHGPLVNMSETDTWYRPGTIPGNTNNIQIRRNIGGTHTGFYESSKIGTQIVQGTYYRQITHWNKAVNMTEVGAIAEAVDYSQGLAWDGTYIYISGSDQISRYGTDGTLHENVTNDPGGESWGDLEIADIDGQGAMLYAVRFGSTESTQIYKFNPLNLAGGATLVADISDDMHTDANGLVWDGVNWIVGETSASSVNLHLYVYDESFDNLLETIIVPQNDSHGVQSMTLKGNLIYLTMHSGPLYVFQWNTDRKEIRLVDKIDTGMSSTQGIAWDSQNNRFYLADMNTGEILFVTFDEHESDIRMLLHFADDVKSVGTVSHTITSPNDQDLFGIGGYRTGRFAQLFVRASTFPDPLARVGSEVSLYNSENPTISPNSSVVFTSLSSFSESATKNGGEIKYQLSNNDGTTWYWYNSGWVETSSGYTEANIATDMNSNISTFPTGDGNFIFKAFLNSDGDQLVQLDNIEITYSANTAPNSPTMVSPPSPEDVSYITDTTPTLSANYSDPDVGDVGTTKYGIAVSVENCVAQTFVVGCGSTCSGTSAETVDEGEDTTWTPSSSIGDDGTYYWCAQNDDGIETSDWTGMGSFILDTVAPVVQTLSPTNNATGVEVNSNLVITFSEAVDAKAGANNNIVIKKTSDNSTVETVDAEDAKVTSSGTAIITINPAVTLNSETSYYVQIGADAFDDSAGNSYGGIADTTTWSFTTVDAVDSTTPMRSNGFPSGSQSVGTTQTTMSLTTDENATCKYSTTAGTAYDSMTGDFSTTGGTSHSVIISDLSNGQSYNYYVRCTDDDNVNSDDYTISFAVDPLSGSSRASVLSTRVYNLPSVSTNFTKDLQLGSKDNQVKVLQQFLNQNGFNLANMGIGSIGNETDYFGPLTANALIKFQEANKGKITGLTNEKGYLGRITREFISLYLSGIIPTYSIQQTSNIPSIIFTVSLYKDMQSEDVLRLQQLLATKPEIYPEALTTGYFGILTKKAVQRFQLEYGVVNSQSDPGFGYVGPKTRAKLQEVFGN